ncbi:hypothetical protein WJX73_010670 [Symbiochloris irregularis]|uniref:Acylphosphatase n=1 Tax=Symbiochloris irregularis TaxID=706552 RepID=A0AAW1NN68_9CHLO
MSYAAFHYEVQGKVQGVFFRVYTSKEAERLKVVGWVQNTSSGHVEGEIQGQPDQVEEMKEWLKTRGSPGSRIDKCIITDEKSNLKELSYSSFETRR